MSKEDKVLEELREALDNYAEAKTTLKNAVGKARWSQVSWEKIGKVLGVSRQGAQQKFADVWEQQKMELKD